MKKGKKGESIYRCPLEKVFLQHCLERILLLLVCDILGQFSPVGIAFFAVTLVDSFFFLVTVIKWNCGKVTIKKSKKELRRGFLSMGCSVKSYRVKGLLTVGVSSSSFWFRETPLVNVLVCVEESKDNSVESEVSD